MLLIYIWQQLANKKYYFCIYFCNPENVSVIHPKVLEDVMSLSDNMNAMKVG